MVTSFDPLIAYFHQDGLVRLATEPYSNSSDSLSEKFIHLTNYSVNKNSENFIKNTNPSSEEQFSSKLSFPQLRSEYQKMGIDSDEIFQNIRELCNKSLISVESEITAQM